MGPWWRGGLLVVELGGSLWALLISPLLKTDHQEIAHNDESGVITPINVISNSKM